MHFIIAIMFAITVFLAFIEDYLQELQKLAVLAVYVVFMVLLASTKSIENTADATGYEEMFLHNDNLLLEISTEPTFIYLSRIILAFGGTVSTLFFVYAVITIPAKMKALYSLTPYIFTALVIYIPIYFEVHDMIQIRAAAAAMFFLTSLRPIAEKRYWKASLLIACSILFHYSAVAYLPILLLGNRRLSPAWRIVVACLLPVTFAMYLLKLDLFSFIPSALVGGKLDFYREASASGEWDELSPPYLNLYFLAKCLVLYLCLYYYDYIVERNPLAPLLINLFATSICFLLSMATIPVIAGRVSDMFGVVDGIVFTFCLYIISPKYIVRTGITIAALFMLVYNILYTEYFI